MPLNPSAPKQQELSPEVSWRIAVIERFGPGGFTGCTFGNWLKILYRNGFSVDVKYWPRAAVVTFNSILNSLWRRWENFRYAAKIERTPVPPPLFVLGIWRSGTTHLHNLLAKDDRFAFPNTYQVFYPHTFLCTEAWNSPTLQRFMPSTRPMDNVKNGVAEPQEDEFALTACGLSFLIGAMAFPRTSGCYRRYLSMRDATPAEIDLWKVSFLWFLRKLTLKYGRPLVLKSPGHTSRIKLLLELFPQAKFVHIHRHPYAVFQSSVHTMKRALPFWALQTYEPDVEQIIQDYIEVYDAFFAQRHLIPAENFCEIAFERLEQDPIEEMRRIYETLSLPDFDYVVPKLRDYLQSIDEYAKNRFPELPSDMRERLAGEWGRCFEEWRYAT